MVTSKIQDIFSRKTEFSTKENRAAKKTCTVYGYNCEEELIIVKTDHLNMGRMEMEILWQVNGKNTPENISAGFLRMGEITHSK
jgi:hypothetical protein